MRKLWFTAEGAKTVASYDPATRTIDWMLGTGQHRRRPTRPSTRSFMAARTRFVDAPARAARMFARVAAGVAQRSWY